MRKQDEGPRSGPVLWILAVLGIVVAAKADRRCFAPSFAALAAAHFAYGQPTGLSA